MEGEQYNAPPCFNILEPERLGKFVWISGPPGLGKSTTAQLLNRNHGYVYYEGDCFFMGEGSRERKEMADKVVRQFRRMFRGEEFDFQVIEEGVRMICQDIKKERSRIGGDWAVCCVLHTRKIREIVREELGEDLLVICLAMEPEDQMARIRSRHSGDEKVVERMKTVYNLCEPAGPDETNTCEVKIDSGKTPEDVLNLVLEKINTK